MQAGVFLLLTLVFSVRARGAAPLVLPVGGKLCVGLLSGTCCYLLLQTVPMPAEWIEYLQPSAYAAYRLAPGHFGYMPLSVDTGSTLAMCLRLLAYTGVFLLVMLLVRIPGRAACIAIVIVGCAVLQTIYGIAVRTHWGSGLWDPGFTANAVSGTYVNRNHFAGLMVLAVSLCAGGLVQRGFFSAAGADWKSNVSSIISWLLSSSLWLLFALLITIGGLILSTSRGGLLAAGGGLLIAGIVSRRWGAVMHGTLLLGLIALFAIAWLGGGTLGEKLIGQGLESNRPLLARTTLTLIGQAPVLGGGGGTFEWRFPAVRGPELEDLHYDHAHNDYLETLADLGLFGGVLLGTVLTLGFWRIAKGLRARHDKQIKALLYGVLAALSGALLHALVDFNFRIPANAAYFFALLGLGIAAADRQHLYAQRREIQV